MQEIIEPKVALVTTTINVPNVLALYREHNADVRFFVAADKKTPVDAAAFCNALPNTRYILPSEQERWACSPSLGWNCIQRRNIATLEALEWGADILIYFDDDNLALNDAYFDQYVARFVYPFNGPCIQAFNTWFDPGSLLVPPVKHRGFPFGVTAPWGVKTLTKAKIGACAGLVLGNPDIESITRLADEPHVYGITELARYGVAVDNHALTVFNSQNSAFLREFAPALFLAPGIGRYDDIFASLVCQRVMREHASYVHMGPPPVYQDRNPHNLVTDLKNEMLGIEHVHEFGEWLDHLHLNGVDVTAQTQAIWFATAALPWMPVEAASAAIAWCEDVRRAMR